MIVCNEQGTDRTRTRPHPVVDRRRQHDRFRNERAATRLAGHPGGRFSSVKRSGSNGQLYELMDPLNTTGVTLDRTTGTFTGGVGASNLVTPRLRSDAPHSRASGSSATARRTSTGTTPASGRRTADPATRTTSSYRTTLSPGPLRSRTSPSPRTWPGTVFGLRVGLRHELRPGTRVRVRPVDPSPRRRPIPTSRPKASPPD